MTTAPDAAWRDWLSARQDEHLQELMDFLRIPSVSALPRHRSDMTRAAEWLKARLQRAGVPEVEIWETGGQPLVWGRWLVSPDLPTALIYAHYDVQPADPLDLWTSPPFEPVVRDDRIYARGAADDKGGLVSTILAVEALARTTPTGMPPINLVFFYEGEEEIGSPSVAPLIARERDRLRCDVVLSADGVMYGQDAPALTVATKGLAACQINVRTARGDLHSGLYGASVPNAAQVLARLVATLHADDGRVAVAGFYDRVRDLTLEERAEIAAVPFDEAAFKEEAGVTALWGEPGYSPLERNWARPTIDVNGIWGGFQGEGSKTVTPAEAHAKLTCRLVPDQEPDEIIALIEQHLREHCPPGATVEIEPTAGNAHPFAISRDNPFLHAAARVLREIYGKEPLWIRLGGTLPIAADFQRELGADMVFLAWCMPDGNAHAPNEWYSIEDFRRSAIAYCKLLTIIGNDGVNIGNR